MSLFNISSLQYFTCVRLPYLVSCSYGALYLTLFFVYCLQKQLPVRQPAPAPGYCQTSASTPPWSRQIFFTYAPFYIVTRYNTAFLSYSSCNHWPFPCAISYLPASCLQILCPPISMSLKVVTSEKIGGSGVMSTLGTWYGGVVMGVLLPFNEAAILYRHFNCAPLQKQKIIVFAANNSRCCEWHVAPTIIW